MLSGRVKGKKSMANFIDSALERRTPIVPVRPAKKDTLAYLVFSSGTTGLPKGMSSFRLLSTKAYICNVPKR